MGIASHCNSAVLFTDLIIKYIKIWKHFRVPTAYVVFSKGIPYITKDNSLIEINNCVKITSGHSATAKQIRLEKKYYAPL